MTTLAARSLAVVSALLAASVSSVAAACPANARGCNPPQPYSSLNASNSLPTIVASSGFDADMRAKVNLGHQAVIDFIGGVEPVTAFLFEANGAASAYADMETQMCDDFLAGEYCGFDRLVGTATSGGGQYYRGAGGLTCCNGQKQITSVGLYYLPGTSDTADFLAGRAVHEYTHAVQGKFGDMIPSWLMEGGAVHMECLLAHKMPSPMGYAQCMKTSGGRGGVIPNMRGYFASAYGISNGLAKGEDWCCDGACGTGDTASVFAAGGVTSEHHLYYDVGAVAIAWAINKAGKTSRQFWTSKTPGVGFWGAIVPYAGYDYMTGFPSDCPADEGWKKAFAAFTGHANIGAFYAEFDAWARTATEDDVVAILESDADVVAQAASSFDIATADFLSEGIQAAETCGAVETPAQVSSAAGVESAVRLAARTVAAILATAAAMR